MSLPVWFVGLVALEIVIAVLLRAHAPIELAQGQPLTAERALQVGGLLISPALAWTTLRAIAITSRSTMAAHAAELRVREVMDLANDWVWTIDRDGILLDANPAVVRVLGYRPEELIGTSSFRLIDVEDRDRLIRALATGAEHKEGWTERRSLWSHRDGSRRLLQSTAIPLFDVAGELIGFRGASRVLAEPDAGSPAAEQALADLRARIARVASDPGLMTVVFQPIVDLATRRVVGAEALARFHEEPLRPPDAWFRDAVDVGLGPYLEVAAIERALPALKALRRDQYLTINVSPSTLVDGSVVQLVVGSDEPARLVVEVTERDIVTDYGALLAALSEMRSAGVRIAVDDAGAGYSGLAQILRVRPDFIKLDKDLTAGIDRDPVRAALATALVTFGASIDATIVAEGVEHEREVAGLRRAGVRFAQGYLLGMPARLGGPGAASG